MKNHKRHYMRCLSVQDYTSMPWKNGGGVTREVAKSSDSQGLIWRLSLADVTQEGTFSTFPKLSRILTITQGAGMRLIDTDTNKVLLASLHTPTAFSGDQPITSELIDGTIQDFNVIYDQTKTTANVRIIDGPKHTHIESSEGQIRAIYSLFGTFKINQHTLIQYETAVFNSTDRVQMTCEYGSKALLVTFTPRP